MLMHCWYDSSHKGRLLFEDFQRRTRDINGVLNVRLASAHMTALGPYLNTLNNNTYCGTAFKVCVYDALRAAGVLSENIISEYRFKQKSAAPTDLAVFSSCELILLHLKRSFRERWAQPIREVGYINRNWNVLGREHQGRQISHYVIIDREYPSDDAKKTIRKCQQIKKKLRPEDNEECEIITIHDFDSMEQLIRDCLK